MYRHLLVPTDGSVLATAAVEAAVTFARQIHARITFFHAQPGFLGRSELALYGESLMLDPQVAEQFSRANAAYAAEVLGAAQRLAEAAGVPAQGLTGVHPQIHEAILTTAAEQGCDLIFMASHGRRGLAGLLLGSETQRVLSHSLLPVLVHRQPQA